MDGIIATSGALALLLLIGGLLALLRPSQFDGTWFFVAGALVVINDAMLTNVYGLIPDLLPTSEWNWQGKILALIATLAIATLPTFGWKRSGLTWHQAAGSLKASVPVMVIYMGFFAALAWAFPSEAASAETIAFQLTMPGLEEEPFYRGILLVALDRAFLSRKSFLGVEWGWGAILSSIVFGLAHALAYSSGQFTFDPLVMALTGIPSIIGVWLVLKTRSLLLPIALHNFGNAITLIF